MNINSWGRYPKGAHQKVTPIFWKSDLTARPLDDPISYLPYGQGLSYGDSCLNFGNGLFLMRGLDRFIRFDVERGILECEAGATLDEILQIIVPRGWFLPVTPGTKYITLGGAIANDVHGKDHHKSGTFGRHVREFKLWRSDKSIAACSPVKNSGLYAATIGGLGLTGVILSAEIQLIPIRSSYLEVEYIRYDSLKDFFQISQDSEKFDYSVAWIDCLNTSDKNLGRGIFMRGNFLQEKGNLDLHSTPPRWMKVPCDAPGFCVNPLSMRAFNALYYGKQSALRTKKTVHYNPFFYPLDAIKGWNRCYGKNGFFQYQFVIPYEERDRGIVEILKTISRSGQGSFLAVIKTFGSVASPGLLSFPRPGITLALDFANKGSATLDLFRKLDILVRRYGGRLYPAKDARMPADFFRDTYENLKDFSDYVDPKFSSSFWRRTSV